MDDIIIVVIVFIVLTLSLARYMKRNTEESEESPWQHLPKDMNPETYAAGTAPTARENPSPPPRAQGASRTETNRHTSPSLPDGQPEEEEETEFDVNSPEEVRRGIIWSEILSRKY